MRSALTGSTVTMLALTVMASAAGAQSGNPSCPADSVSVGAACIDKYESSVWRVPDPTTANATLVRKIQLGRATRADLTAGGATQLGTTADDYAPCADNGQNCANDIYALSLPVEIPSAFATWFQAQEACANAGKRLPTNAEWQIGADGTPDAGPDNGTTDCNTGHIARATLTGSRAACVSARGAFDMVGNLIEWVADWTQLSTTCPGWGDFSDDFMCLAGASTDGGPGALLRGDFFGDGTSAGPLSIVDIEPFRSLAIVGFRCAR